LFERKLGVNTIINSITISGASTVIEELANKIKASCHAQPAGDLFFLGEAFFPVAKEASPQEQAFWSKEYQSGLVVEALEFKITSAQPAGKAQTTTLTCSCETNGRNMATFLQRLSALFKVAVCYEFFDLDFHIHNMLVSIVDGKIIESKQTLVDDYRLSTEDYEADIGPVLPVWEG
jgi:hypothetical protein